MQKVSMEAIVSRLNPVCRAALEKAASISIIAGHREVTPEHFMVALSEESGADMRILLQNFNIDPDVFADDVRKSFSRIRESDGRNPRFSHILLELLQDSWLVGSMEFNEPFIRGGSVLFAMLQDTGHYVHFEYAKHIDSINVNDLRTRFSELVKGSIETHHETSRSSSPSRQATNPGASESALERFAHCFTEAARQGKIDPVFCRDEEIRQIIDILARRRKNNPICVGEAGVGKTAVVEGLALRVIEDDVPDSLKKAEIWGLDLGALQAGASVSGEFERRLKTILDEIKSADHKIILFIDEAHTLIGAGGQQGGSDAANLLKPALARGEIKTIAATTWSEYKKYFEKDPALTRRFQLVSLGEPTVEQARLIIHGLIPAYEKAHGVYITDEAATAAAHLSARYIMGRHLPDKAIDVLDTACARVQANFSGTPAILDRLIRKRQVLEREQQALLRDRNAGFLIEGVDVRLERIEKQIRDCEDDYQKLNEQYQEQKKLAEQLRALRDTEEKGEENRQELIALRKAFNQLHQDNPLISLEVGGSEIASVIADWTGIPVSSMSRDETAKLLTLAQTIKKTIRGQDNALRLVEEQLQTSRLDLSKQERPLGVFLFVGPSGVGKTETALEIARKIFGGEQFLTTINMTEYQERHALARLIGSPPGYVGYGEGGLLTEAIRKKPYSVVLLDEVEKADPGILNLFYQAFDKGELTDGEGRKIDCKNIVFFLTSNLASEQIEQIMLQAAEQNKSVGSEQILELIQPQLSAHFKPALLARMRPIVYIPLSEQIMAEIVDAKLNDLKERMEDKHNLTFSVSDEAQKHLCSQCIQAASGARLVDQILQRRLIPSIAKCMLELQLNGQQLLGISVDYNPEEEFVFDLELKNHGKAEEVDVS